MINGDERCRVYNKMSYDIGVKLITGLEYNIPAGSFQIMTINDVLSIESAYQHSRFFSTKKLIACDLTGKEYAFEELGLWNSEDACLSKEEISAGLKLNLKKFEQWLGEITDETELHAIYTAAKEQPDLPVSKLKILKAKMPNKDWLDELT